VTFQLGPARVTYPGWFTHGQIDFDAPGVPVIHDTWQVSSPFGPRPPIEIKDENGNVLYVTTSTHTGADFWRPDMAGTPLLHFGDKGVVTAMGPAINGYGNAIFVQCDSGYQLLYAHMQPGLHPDVGNVVERGGSVGQVGTTGASTGPHLHFGVLQPGLPTITDVSRWIDPALWVNPMSFFSEVIDTVTLPTEPPLLGALPSPGGMALMTVAYNCDPEDIGAWLANEPSAHETALFVLIGGYWRQYIFGAPAQVNALFPNPLTAGTAVVVKAA
jgi:murein DD-endopeptidase MepM/ murein hydrolase activator NlpD